MAKNVGWKWAVRNRVWDVLDAKRISPGCHNRIPNFVGAAEAARNLASLPEFINSSPLELDHTINIDLMVSGAVAVNPENGFRLGKGKGYADIEYSVLKAMHAVDDSVVVVAAIHDEQIVVNDLPSEKLGKFDVGVDVVVTPTQVIRVKQRLPRPAGILWDELSEEQLRNIDILRKLQQRQRKHS